MAQKSPPFSHISLFTSEFLRNESGINKIANMWPDVILKFINCSSRER